MEININIKSDTSAALAKVLHFLEHIMSKVDDLQAAVAANTSAVDSVVTLIDGMVVQLQTLKDELAAQGADTARLQGFIDEISSSNADLAQAVVVGTPADTDPEPQP